MRFVLDVILGIWLANLIGRILSPERTPAPPARPYTSVETFLAIMAVACLGTVVVGFVIVVCA